jgi:perosamine synthetase
MIAQGPEVAAFEQEFAAFVGGPECVAVNSGTSALHLGCSLPGIGPGDEVIVPSFTFAATANAVALTGATPVFVDIDPDTFCLDPAAAEAAITRGPRRSCPCTSTGIPADMRSIEAVATTHGLLVVEDAAQAHGASLDGTPSEPSGRVAAFSFYPTKNMTTRRGRDDRDRPDADVARTARLLRNQGMEQRYQQRGRRLQHPHDRHRGRHRSGAAREAARTGPQQRANAHAYSIARLELGASSPPVAEGAEHVYHQYTIRAEPRPRRPPASAADDGRRFGVYYPTPVHRLPSFGLALDLPETERAAAEVLSLPVHPPLRMRSRSSIGSAVQRAVNG